jgi:hypothetical protein
LLKISFNFLLLQLLPKDGNQRLFNDKENVGALGPDAMRTRAALARSQLEQADNLRHTLAQADRAAEEVRPRGFACSSGFFVLHGLVHRALLQSSACLIVDLRLIYWNFLLANQQNPHRR